MSFICRRQFRRWLAMLLACSVVASAPALAQQKFAELVGPVTVKPVQETEVLQVPFITWGGDVATFHANGGLTTKPGTDLCRSRSESEAHRR